MCPQDGTAAGVRRTSSHPYSPNDLELDFSHLRVKGVGYARHQSPPKEVIEVRTLPIQMIRVLVPFAPLFSKRVWQNAQVLLIGAILAPGRRTVSSALRAMGLGQHKRFHRYHRVLSRASFSSREAGRILLGLLVETFVPEGGPLVVGVDETLERRYGKKIRAKGVYRDPLRSTHENFVKSSGLRWVCVMLLVEVAWASRVWAFLPFVCALAPSERYAAQRGKRHKKITEWAWQLLLLLRRCYPEREIIAVAESAYASLKLLFRCQSLSRAVTFITRLRLDAALYEPAPARRPGQRGRPRLKGERVPNLSLWWLKIQTQSGSSPLLPTGMEKGIAWSKLLQKPQSGTARACSPYPFAGCWCVIRRASSKPRLSCVYRP
jgi:hypothetical protein